MVLQHSHLIGVLMERVCAEDLLYELSDVENALDEPLLGSCRPVPFVEALAPREDLKQPCSRYLHP